MGATVRICADAPEDLEIDLDDHICGVLAGQTVWIGSLPYRIKTSERVLHNGQELEGSIVYSDLELLLRSTQKPALVIQTLFHEIIHGILKHAGHNEDSDNEGLVEALAYGLYNLISANPDLLIDVIECNQRILSSE